MHLVGDIDSLLWYEKNSDIGPTYISLEIGFSSNDLPTVFSNLSFGFILYDNDKEIYSYTYKENKYISSDQDSIYAIIIPDLITNEQYTLKIWAENNDNYFDKIINIVTPLPPFPYPSWKWNKDNNNWEPPIPMPDMPPIGGWIWDETSQSWLD